MGAFYMDNKPILKELKLIEKFAFLWKIALVNFLHKMSKGKSCFFVNSKEIVDLCSCRLGDTEWHAAINGKLVCRAANTAAGKLGTRQRSKIGDGLPIREEGEGERGRVLWPVGGVHSYLNQSHLFPFF
ncbi:hypothetical protein HanRHA438_Chr03g0133931 [Helianthus annuus]|uniref:Uncharacterized protein n=1 Tax=Helianthus annuus TaxID=4232 RepID=A0A9K3JIN1_HELAN|nr:hypothetical protein HanXRQr2_Chr03g0121971 [Helianthus annuus]KAJ0593828.1 hypothetical protein HanHA300_Chr03g0101871 [Helianthus annuus]KAJ0608851.1 hypothetical protein HanHA89_Chr03g0113551 [Helianthus annuus]KAJ0936686.1 hypothetical protein HanRHA438_Chr03g0133931 [Helianthus annuus]